MRAKSKIINQRQHSTMMLEHERRTRPPSGNLRANSDKERALETKDGYEIRRKRPHLDKKKYQATEFGRMKADNKKDRTLQDY